MDNIEYANKLLAESKNISNKIDISNLGLSERVIRESSTMIPLSGNITNNDNEIIIFEKFYDLILWAHVCHITEISKNGLFYIITMPPGYPTSRIMKIEITETCGIKYGAVNIYQRNKNNNCMGVN